MDVSAPRPGCNSERWSLLPFVVALAFLISQPASLRAEVLDSGSAGFTTRHSVTIPGSRAAVYRAAVRQVGSWWSDDLTVSGHASNLSIDPRPQGCFCERLGENAGVVHMTVTFVNPTVMLRLTGGLGPLGLLGASGNMTWEFADSADGTVVTWSYAVGGYLEGGLGRMADAVDDVLVQQMKLLKEFVENHE